MKRSLFNNQFNTKKEKNDFIDEQKLNEVKNDVHKLLEIKKCKVCKKKKVIYYFQIDESIDEYSDICIECKPEDNKKTCKKCGESKELTEFYTVRDRGHTEICRKCVQELVMKNKHTKVCKGCNRELLAIPKYFKIAGHYPDYLENKCRVCRGLKYLK